MQNKKNVSAKAYTYIYTLKNERMKTAELEKMGFIKVNELKLTEVELF